MADRSSEKRKAEKELRPKSPLELIDVPLELSPEDELYETLQQPLPKGANYDTWKPDHLERRRFYVGGYHWLSAASQIKKRIRYLEAAKQATDHIRNETSWFRILPELNTPLPAPQVDDIRKFKAVSFTKAVLFIAASEIILARAIQNNSARKQHKFASSVYENMRVVSACWNIDNFNNKFRDRLLGKHSDAFRCVAEKLGFDDEDVLFELSDCHTVTKKTADEVKAAIENLYPDFRLGLVRPRPGRGTIGTGDAAPSESPFLG